MNGEGSPRPLGTLHRLDADRHARSQVEAPGIESPVTSAPIVITGGENHVENATRPDAEQPAVSASQMATVSLSALALGPDGTLKLAIIAAVQVGDTRRARALLDVLELGPRPAAVTPLVAVRDLKGRA